MKYRDIDQEIIDFCENHPKIKRGYSPNYFYTDDIGISILVLSHDFAEWQKSIGEDFDESNYKNVMIFPHDDSEKEVFFSGTITTIDEFKKEIEKYL